MPEDKGHKDELKIVSLARNMFNVEPQVILKDPRGSGKCMYVIVRRGDQVLQKLASMHLGQVSRN